MKRYGIDPLIFFSALVIILIVCVPIFVWPAQSGAAIEALYALISHSFGLVYQWTVIGIVGFLAWVAFSKHGSIKLGEADEGPQFSTFSWVSMLFCAGVGAGLVYWATIEWVYYADSPPFGVEADTNEALRWATAYGLFHWGVIAWAIYALPTVAIAYAYYVEDIDYLRLSTACHRFLGPSGPNSIRARIIDSFFMLALIAGAGTSMGLAVPMISANLADAIGLERSFGLDASVVLASVALFAFTVFVGIEKGIQRLADLNVLAALLFLVFILIAGPTLFILRVGTESIGFMLQNTIVMLTYTDPIIRSGFVEDWTIFYWAWWIAFGPFVGIFVARISRGRTLRELILYMVFFGSLGAWVFYIVMGNYALFLDINEIIPVRQILNEIDPAQAISATVGSLPFGAIAQIAFAAISIIFIATTYNSAAYALASSASLHLEAGHDPNKWHRLFWALILGLLPLCLMLAGGTRVAMSAVLVASMPLLIIAILMCFNLFGSLKEHPHPSR
ncbi:MAG: BCCT family transporter [Pseudomonadota bacterium]